MSGSANGIPTHDMRRWLATHLACAAAGLTDSDEEAEPMAEEPDDETEEAEHRQAQTAAQGTGRLKRHKRDEGQEHATDAGADLAEGLADIEDAGADVDNGQKKRSRAVLDDESDEEV